MQSSKRCEYRHVNARIWNRDLTFRTSFNDVEKAIKAGEYDYEGNAGRR